MRQVPSKLRCVLFGCYFISCLVACGGSAHKYSQRVGYAGGYSGDADYVASDSEEVAAAPPSGAPSQMRVQAEHRRTHHRSTTRIQQSAETNPFVSSAQDAKATFSLDVDTASYTMMRNAVTGGILPKKRSVRTEEFINFFRFPTMSQARGKHPFAVDIEHAPSPFGQNMRLLRVAVAAQHVDARNRPPTNLVFLIDTSGSMQSQGKLDLVIYSLTQLVTSLRPTDTIGIVTYAGNAGVLLPPTPVSERGTLLSAIQSLRAGGSTNGEGGIRVAYDQAAQHLQRGGINRVILATDGDFNVGATGNTLVDLIVSYRKRGVTLTALGYGRSGHNDALMEQLADKGNGNYAFIDSKKEALRVLTRDLSGTLQVVAKDVKVQVEFNKDVVKRFRLIGYENRVLAHKDFGNDKVDAAEVGAGQFVTALLEYELKGSPQSEELAKVHLRYKKPEGDKSILVSHGVETGSQRSLAESSDAFRFSAAVAEFSEVLRGSEHVREPDFAKIIKLAKGATGQSSDHQEFVSLVEKAEVIHKRMAK